ncbi:MAG: hypothetical protein U1E62_25105 [Alsobacter sp.]
MLARPPWRALMVATALLFSAGLPAVLAQDSSSPDWPAVKCERYRKAWADLLARRGDAGLTPAFLERHEAFLASGCTAQADVCPRTPQELEVANILSLRAINAGMTGSFLPFACR